ncbi:MAG: hypothetical protein AAB426_05495 [Myxococcota bacterium]
MAKPRAARTPVPASPESQIGATAAQPGSRRFSRLAKGLGIVAVGLTAVGVLFGSKAQREYGHATDADYVGGQAAINTGERAKLLANLSFGLAGASAATALIIVQADRNKNKAAIAPVVSPTGIGATLWLNW